MADKWVTVNGRHVQVKDGKLSINSKSKTVKKSDNSDNKITKHKGYKSKVDQTNNFSQKEVKKKGK